MPITSEIERALSTPGKLIPCEAFYDAETHRILIHVPQMLTPTTTTVNVKSNKRGRPRLYTEEERKIRHREQALRSYYKRKAKINN